MVAAIKKYWWVPIVIAFVCSLAANYIQTRELKISDNIISKLDDALTTTTDSRNRVLVDKIAIRDELAELIANPTETVIEKEVVKIVYKGMTPEQVKSVKLLESNRDDLYKQCERFRAKVDGLKSRFAGYIRLDIQVDAEVAKVEAVYKKREGALLDRIAILERRLKQKLVFGFGVDVRPIQSIVNSEIDWGVSFHLTYILWRIL